MNTDIIVFSKIYRSKFKRMSLITDPSLEIIIKSKATYTNPALTRVSHALYVDQNLKPGGKEKDFSSFILKCIKTFLFFI